MRQKIYSSSNRSFENKNQSARPLDEDFLHTENLILIYEYRHIRCVYDGLNNNSVNLLLHDIDHIFPG